MHDGSQFKKQDASTETTINLVNIATQYEESEIMNATVQAHKKTKKSTGIYYESLELSTSTQREVSDKSDSSNVSIVVPNVNYKFASQGKQSLERAYYKWRSFIFIDLS